MSANDPTDRSAAGAFGKGADIEPPEAIPSLGETGLALIACGLLCAVYLRTLLPHFADRMGPGYGDPQLLLVQLKWAAHQIALGLPDFWNAPFFFPTRGVTALSDHMLGPGLELLALTRLGLGHVASFNLLFVTAYALTGGAVWWVLRATGRSWTASLLGGMAYAFSSFRWDQAYHLQLLIAQWLPLLLWSFDRLLVRPTWRRAAVFLAFYLLHLTGGTYLAYIAHLPLVALVATHWGSLRQSLRTPRSALVLAAAATVSGVCAVALFWPYWRISHTLGLARDPGEYRHWGATLLSYLSPSPANLLRLLGWQHWARPENALFAGFVPLALAVVGWRSLRQRSDPAALLPAAALAAPAPPSGGRRRLAIAVALAVAAAGFALGEWRTWTGAERLATPLFSMSLRGYLKPCALVLLGAGTAAWLLRRRFEAQKLAKTVPSLAPFERGLLLAGGLSFLLTFPVFFTPAAALVPGLGGMRVAPRFVAVFSLALALLAARGFDALRDRIAGRRQRALAAGALVAALAVELAPRPFDWVSIAEERDFSAADRWLAEHEEVRALIDLPLAIEGETWQEVLPMYRASLHWRPIVNGFSGYLAPSYLEARRAIRVVPEGAGLDLLRRYGVTHFVVRGAGLRGRPAARRHLARWLARVGRPGGPAVEQVFTDGVDTVFRILPSRAAAGLAAPPATTSP